MTTDSVMNSTPLGTNVATSAGGVLTVFAPHFELLVQPIRIKVTVELQTAILEYFYGMLRQAIRSGGSPASFDVLSVADDKPASYEQTPNGGTRRVEYARPVELLVTFVAVGNYPVAVTRLVELVAQYGGAVEVTQ